MHSILALNPNTLCHRCQLFAFVTVCRTVNATNLILYTIKLIKPTSSATQAEHIIAVHRIRYEVDSVYAGAIDMNRKHSLWEHGQKQALNVPWEAAKKDCKHMSDIQNKGWGNAQLTLFFGDNLVIESITSVPIKLAHFSTSAVGGDSELPWVVVNSFLRFMLICAHVHAQLPIIYRLQ